MFLMWGYEGEELSDIEATIEHVKESNPDIFFTTVAYPIKNTGYYEKVKKKLIFSSDWNNASDRELLVSGRHTQEVLQARRFVAQQRRRRAPTGRHAIPSRPPSRPTKPSRPDSACWRVPTRWMSERAGTVAVRRAWRPTTTTRSPTSAIGSTMRAGRVAPHGRVVAGGEPRRRVELRHRRRRRLARLHVGSPSSPPMLRPRWSPSRSGAASTPGSCAPSRSPTLHRSARSTGRCRTSAD